MKMTFTLVLTMLCLRICGQEPESPLKIGQPFPTDLTLNYRGQPTPLSAWKGKNIILDFFNSDCAVCFQTMPKIDTLQRKYKGKVDFIMVGKEDGRIQKIYERFEKRLNFQMEKAFDSALANKLVLPANPIYVWIDRDNIVRAISSGDKLNSDTIDLFIKGGAPSTESFIYKPVFKSLAWQQEPPNKDTNAFYIRTFLSIADSTSGNFPVSLDFSENGPFFNAVNRQMNQLYHYAFFKSAYFNVGDERYGNAWQELYIESPSGGKPVRFNCNDALYSFSFYTNQANRDTAILRKTMVAALENYFHYTAEIQYLPMPYFSLQCVKGAKPKISTKGGVSKVRRSASHIELVNSNLDRMFEAMQYYSRDPRPFINDTGITGSVDLYIEAPLVSLKAVNETLRSKGLEIVDSSKLMAVIVLKAK
jgi:thiol-disulfide isomerase/thioredoxin